jgi:uncharacterized membrane protein YgcG
MSKKSSILSPLNKAVLEQLFGSDMRMEKRKGEVRIRLDQEIQNELAKAKDEGPPSLMKSVMNALGKDEIVRLAFESDPALHNQYQSLYKNKLRLIPDKLLKRIAIQDDLVSSIINARQNQMSAFGRPRPDRFSTGFIIELRQEANERIEAIKDPEQKQQMADEVQARIAKVTKRLMTCGDPDALGEDDTLSFPEYISESVRNALIVGRLATEVIWSDGPDGKKHFSCFRVIDAGTIYRAAPQRAAAEQVRRQARMLLEQIKNKKLVPERYQNDEYSWVQVIDDRPVQAFTSKECLVHNFYRVPDVELDGYPVTPLDTIISAVTTHINITTHNKLYFQSGRAARGMLVIKSDDVDESVISRIRQQFNASINSVQNAWRMPVFGIGQDDDISWQPIDQGSRDMEFQYLMDMNARIILSAFQMSPEELPGWSYLSRGTNNQALSEGNNEYRLEAARDLGIRPLLARFEDFLNAHILPLFDESLASMCSLKLVGLDAETAEKESVRIQQDMPVHMTYDEVLKKVEKQPIGKRWGGEIPLNPTIKSYLDQYFTVGEILEHFCGVAGASKDPTLAYRRDQFWFNQAQMIQQQQQMQAQAQAQAAGGGQPPGGGDDGGGGGEGGGGDDKGGDDSGGGGQQAPSQDAPTENEKSSAVSEASASGDTDLTRSIDQAIGALSKSEKQLPPSKRRLLAQHKKLVENAMNAFEEDLGETLKDILGVATKFKPKA